MDSGKKIVMTHHASAFRGIVPPLSTPFTSDYEVDTASLQRLIEFQLAAGVHGVFVLGSTGEVAFLTDQQRATVIDVAVRTVAGQVPVLAGIFDMTTARVLEHVRQAEHAGVDALVLTAPYYTRVSQAEIIEHFRLVHAAIHAPLLAYDIPVAVQAKITCDTMVQMADEGLIHGIKDSSGDYENFRAIVLALGDRSHFSLFTGSELLTDAAFLLGAHGCVPGLGNVDPAGYMRLYEAVQTGDWQRARHEQERLFRLFAIVKAAWPRIGVGSAAMGAFKTALQLRGIITTNITGRPSIPLLPEEVAQIRKALVMADLL